MSYWIVKGQANIDPVKDVIIEKIVVMVEAEDANEAIIKTLNEFDQYKLFITSVKYSK